MYPVHWSSKVLFRYKKNAINGKLHRARKISSNFQLETARIKAKFSKAGFPHKVIENTINSCISSVFIYFHWYLKKDNVSVKFNSGTQTTIY